MLVLSEKQPFRAIGSGWGICLNPGIEFIGEAPQLFGKTEQLNARTGHAVSLTLKF